MHRIVLLMLMLGVGGLAPGAAMAQAEEPPDAAHNGVVIAMRLDNVPITPVSARFIERGIREAEEARARCLIIELDTPGGLVESTQGIVKNIIASRVPVAVYVSPSGARAASAGVFITLSAHVAAMAPGTHIGAAHPVTIGGAPAPAPADTTSGGQESSPSVMEQKMVNDAVAWSKSLAELRGRNVEWAALAVSESRSITNTEAVEQNVVDFTAEHLEDLLAQMDGREVELETGPVTLRTTGAELRPLRMWWGDQILAVISNPNVAFMLLMFGFYGILFEFYSPGWGVGGTVGAICLVLGFFGMAVLPINYAGLALIALALGLFVAEAFVPTFGALTLGGVVCLVLGGLMLVDSPIEVMRVSATVVIPVALATAAISVFLVGSVVKAMRGKVQTGSAAMMGTEAVAQQAFAPEDGHYQGLVLTHGELWKAVSTSPVAAGDILEIDKREGLTLFAHTTGRRATADERG